MSLSKSLRFEVFKRDGFRCRYCGQRPPEVILEVDHIVPRCEGGPDDVGNLVTACYACNRGKAGRSLQDVAPQIDEQAVLEQIQENLEGMLVMRSATVAAIAGREALSEAIQIICQKWQEAFGRELNEQDRGSVRHFLRALPLADVSASVDLAQWKFKGQRGWVAFKYFCGTCWGKIKQRSLAETG